MLLVILTSKNFLLIKYILIRLVFSIELMETVIPCEYCGRQIDIPDWTVHTVNE